jgi:hypothetical protein
MIKHPKVFNSFFFCIFYALVNQPRLDLFKPTRIPEKILPENSFGKKLPDIEMSTDLILHSVLKNYKEHYKGRMRLR